LYWVTVGTSSVTTQQNTTASTAVTESLENSSNFMTFLQPKKQAMIQSIFIDSTSTAHGLPSQPPISETTTKINVGFDKIYNSSLQFSKTEQLVETSSGKKLKLTKYEMVC